MSLLHSVCYLCTQWHPSVSDTTFLHKSMATWHFFPNALTQIHTYLLYTDLQQLQVIVHFECFNNNINISK